MLAVLKSVSKGRILYPSQNMSQLPARRVKRGDMYMRASNYGLIVKN
jgi:hypothetical protein